ncbi:hypothetical protein [Sporolactobacillus pectinivorans]|uniref:hypothetical protein n=1 Tax=Sporolactobacillus pectinivorans TaxID=1591408 RepID=UPI0012FD580F|nr:hypothetical protein [Sporolactobacillus pectinivorans]
MKKLLVVLTVTGLLLTFSGFGQVAFADTGSSLSLQPQRVGTVAAWIFDQVTKKENGTFIDVVNGDRYWNTTKDNISLTSSFTGSHTNGSSVSASLGGGWGPINATVGYNANSSYTWSYTEAVHITIRPGYMGWNEYGVGRDEWYGHYYYRDQYGNESSSHWIYVYSPRYKLIKATTQYRGY